MSFVVIIFVRFQSLEIQERVRPNSSDKFNSLLNESSYHCKSFHNATEGETHKVCCSHVCGKDCKEDSDEKKTKKRRSISQMNGTVDKKRSDLPKKRRGPRKQSLVEPIVKLEEEEARNDDPFDRYSNYDDDDVEGNCFATKTLYIIVRVTRIQ